MLLDYNKLTETGNLLCKRADVDISTSTQNTNKCMLLVIYCLYRHFNVLCLACTKWHAVASHRLYTLYMYAGKLRPIYFRIRESWIQMHACTLPRLLAKIVIGISCIWDVVFKSCTTMYYMNRRYCYLSFRLLHSFLLEYIFTLSDILMRLYSIV